ncbi:MAG: hypothetical protein K7J47_20685 [Acidobacteria bacterium]|nr:hypothetical protein [Bryobacteraceae bacterium CoA2 C42]
MIAANAIVGLLADSALVAHKWPLAGGVIKRQTQEGKLTVSDNLGTGTVPPSRAGRIRVPSQSLARRRMEQNAYPGAPSAAAPAAGMIPSIHCPSEDLNPGVRGLGQMLKYLRFLMTVNKLDAR